MTARAYRMTLFLDGWALVQIPDTGRVVRVHFAERDDGRIVVEEIHLADRLGVTSDQLRQIPVSRIEAAANDPLASEEIRRLVQLVTDDQEAEIRRGLHQLTASSKPLADHDDLPNVGEEPAALVELWRRSLRVSIPEGRGRRPDAFYERVARVYGDAARRSRAPAVDVAEANDVTVSTVHRWVKEARQRGIMPAGQRRGERA